MSSRKRHAPPKPRPRPAPGHASPRPSPRRAGPGPGHRRPPFLPAAPRGPPAAATAGGALTSVRVLLQVLLEQREVCAGEKRKAQLAPRDPARLPATRPPAPRRLPAPGPRAGLGPTRGAGERADAGRGGAAAAAAAPPGELGATYPPSCGRPLLLGLPGIRGYMERREPGSRWTRAGGAARRRDGPAGARARGGPRARDWAAGGAAPGRRGWAGAAGPGPRPASPVRSGRPRGGRRSLLPPPSLPARPGPAARAHTLGRRRPHAEQRPELQPARDAAAGGRSRAGPPAARRALLGHGLVGRSPSPRAGRRSLPRAPSPGGTYMGGDPRPGGGRGSHPPGGGSAAPRAPGPVGSGW